MICVCELRLWVVRDGWVYVCSTLMDSITAETGLRIVENTFQQGLCAMLASAATDVILHLQFPPSPGISCAPFITSMDYRNPMVAATSKTRLWAQPSEMSDTSHQAGCIYSVDVTETRTIAFSNWTASLS